MGFSVWGAIVSFAVLAPNVLMVRFPPRPALPHVRVPLIIAALERGGQALCLVIPAITAPGPIVGWWVAPLTVAVAAYFALWLRYLRHRNPKLLYRRTWLVPVPMAVLPVVAFLAAAAWLSNPFIAASACVLAAGHIPASLRTARVVNAAG